MASDTLLLMSLMRKHCRGVFEGLDSLVDVGGGTGMAARAIADEFPDMKCTVLDLPHVVAGLEGTKNLTYVAGNMFEAIPPSHAVFLKVTLDIEKGQYITWSELFKIHAKAYKVLDHIIPPSKEKAKSNSSLSLKDTDPELWSRVDAIVLQWIYGTISDDLLNTILERDSTAELAWNRLEDIFSDNKNSRALYLEQEFSAVRMEQFTDASSYCQHLETLADQLSNVGAPVSNNRLVLQLVSGLTDAYATVGSQIRHEDPLPLFYKARSMIILEETAMAKKIASPYDTALHATADEQIAKNFWENQGGRGGRTSGFNSRGGSSIRGGGYGNSSSRGGGSGNSFSRGGHSINRGSGRGGRQSSHGRAKSGIFSLS
nr:retrovirus-related Pol polyprotein from transposon TNT 1-94 [Ipomoea batatas]